MSDTLNVDELLLSIEEEIAAAAVSTPDEIEAFRIRMLSKKQGQITNLMKRIPEIPPSERKNFGRRVNELKQSAQLRIDRAAEQGASEDSPGTRLDLTLPGRVIPVGSLHPITQTLRQIIRVFESYGFDVAEGPEIEDDWHNFTALNFPPEHPARDMQDTFFIEEAGESHDGILLRTHTSPVQIRVLKSQTPPVRVIVPGRVFRNEAISYKSYCLFQQVEGLFIDEGVSMGDLKHILHVFARKTGRAGPLHQWPC